MRLGINVPDDLLDRMKPFKGSINVSQTCRDALEAQTAAYERAKTRVQEDDLGDLIQRFLQEHHDREVDWEALGHEDAKVWVELSSLKDLELLFYRLSFVGRPGMLQRPETEVVPHIEGAKRFAERWNELDKWVLEKYELDPDAPHHGRAKDAYDLGWFSYVRTVWALLQDQISKDTSEVSARREEAFKGIDVPVHLQAQKLAKD